MATGGVVWPQVAPHLDPGGQVAAEEAVQQNGHRGRRTLIQAGRWPLRRRCRDSRSRSATLLNIAYLCILSACCFTALPGSPDISAFC